MRPLAELQATVLAMPARQREGLLKTSGRGDYDGRVFLALLDLEFVDRNFALTHDGWRARKILRPDERFWGDHFYHAEGIPGWMRAEIEAAFPGELSPTKP